MAAHIRPLGQLKQYINNQPEITVEPGLTVREVLISLKIPSEIVAGVIVNDALQSKDYCIEEEDEIKLYAVMSGGSSITPRVLEIKILSYKSPQRYAVRKTITAAHSELCKRYPDLEIHLSEIKDVPEMLKYTQVLILPSLIVNGKLVCVGRFPKKNETIGWFQSAIELLPTYE